MRCTDRVIAFGIEEHGESSTSVMTLLLWRLDTRYMKESLSSAKDENLKLCSQETSGSAYLLPCPSLQAYF